MELCQWEQLPDISEGLHHRLFEAAGSSCSLQSFLEQAKTKRYTMARLKRIVLSALLKITKGDTLAPIPYIRVLGFNKQGRELLRHARSSCSIPIITHLAETNRMEETARRFAFLESYAGDIWHMAKGDTRPRGEEYRQNPVML